MPEQPAPLLDAEEDTPDRAEASGSKAEPVQDIADRPLKPLTDISWPPEPDAGIFTDPLKRDDPKPLRREELMRIGMYNLHPIFWAILMIQLHLQICDDSSPRLHCRKFSVLLIL
jgi:hypothetical protein